MINKRKLRGAMAAAGYTQGTLSDKLGISDNTLSNKINGKTPLYIGEASQICEILGILNPQEKCDIFLN